MGTRRNRGARGKPPAPAVPDLRAALTLCVPTRDHMGLITSVLSLRDVAAALGRPLFIVQGQGGNIPRARNMALAVVRQQFGPAPRWLLWWDTDILVPPDQVPVVADAIRWAEARGPGAVLADYPQEDQTRTILVRDADGQLRNRPAGPPPADPYVPVEGGGMGLAYVFMDPTTEFHAGQVGEDVHFWSTYPHPRWWATRIRVPHRKAVWLV